MSDASSTSPRNRTIVLPEFAKLSCKTLTISRGSARAGRGERDTARAAVTSDDDNPFGIMSNHF